MKWGIRLWVGLFVLLTFGCQKSPSLPNLPPSDVIARPVTDDLSYITIEITEIQLTENVGGDIDGTGELRFMLLVSDEEGHSAGLFCPAGAPQAASPNDVISPCDGVAFSIREDAVDEQLFLVFLILDEDRGSLATDLGNEAAVSLLAWGAGQAFKASVSSAAKASAAAGGPLLFVAELTLEAAVSFAGSQVKEWIEEQDVLGLQGVRLSRDQGWYAGREYAFKTAQGDIGITYRVSRTTNSPGQVIVVQAPELPPAIIEKDQSSPTPIPLPDTPAPPVSAPIPALPATPQRAPTVVDSPLPTPGSSTPDLLETMQDLRAQIASLGGMIDHAVNATGYVNCREIVSTAEAIITAPVFDVSGELSRSYQGYRSAITIFSNGTHDMVQNCRDFLANPREGSIPFLQWGTARQSINTALEELNKAIGWLE